MAKSRNGESGSSVTLAAEPSSSVREELNRMWIEEGVDNDEIIKDNTMNDSAYKLIDIGRTGDDVDAEFARLSYEQIIEKYGCVLSPKDPVGIKG